MKRVAALCVAVCALLTVVSLRQHIRVLLDVAHTYSGFYPLLDRHPELLYKFPHDPEPAKHPPKIIHHVALGSSNLERFHDAIQSCKTLHPDWEFRLWRDQNATDFLAQHYPDIWPHYVSYLQDIQRANVLRYAVLHKYGGVYLDLDVTCRVAFDQTPLVNLAFVSPGAHPAGVNNAFILTRPGHTFLEYMLSRVPQHDLFWGLPMRLPYVENMFSTGCMFFSNMWMAYTERLVSPGGGETRDPVYVLADEAGHLDPHMLRGVVETPLMAHGGASGWHGWDAAAIVMLGKHYQLVVIMVALSTTLTVVSVLYGCFGSKIRRRRSWAKQGAAAAGLLGAESKTTKHEI